MTASEIENDHFDLDHFDRDKKSSALIQGTGLRCLSNTALTPFNSLNSFNFKQVELAKL